MPSTDSRTTRMLACGLIALGILARLLPHPPNLTPAAALALFGAACLPAGWGIAIPLAMIVGSDLIIGLYDAVAFTWAAFALTALLGWWIRRRPTALRIVAAACLGSLAFFAISNFGVWLVGDHGTAYPKTWSGLVACYTAALPFLRTSMIGDVVYTLAMFELYKLATRRKPVPATFSSR